ncbi:MAG: DUF4202 domain-containing protein [Sandaracinaceae bacterium]|nr:DUF4202 domain-containing protein [Sandaracinaceae bacterium]
MSERLDRALAALDALHAEDPEQVELDGAPVPAELLYARRMTAALAQLTTEPSEELRLAVRAQHLCRWRLPRSSYPDGKAGYHAWRREEARRHAELAAATLREAGYGEDAVLRVGALIQKKDLSRDPAAQAVEDAACLVFLEHYAEAFARGRHEAQLVDIVQKTWRKMSPRARELAHALPLAGGVRALVLRALGA